MVIKEQQITNNTTMYLLIDNDKNIITTGYKYNAMHNLMKYLSRHNIKTRTQWKEQPRVVQLEFISAFSTLVPEFSA